MGINYTAISRVLVTGLVMAALIAVLLGMTAGQAAAAPPPPYIIQLGDGTTIPYGGDCSMIGTWDGGSTTCTLNQDVGLSVEGTGATPSVIQIEGDNITIDGAGHTISGINKTGTGINISPPYTGLSVSNANFGDLYYGIEFFTSSSGEVTSSNFRNGLLGVFLIASTNVQVAKSEFEGNADHDVSLENSITNTIRFNDFIDDDNLYIDNSSNNSVYFNSFLDPTGSSTIAVTGSSSGNVFTVAPFGGNYWETYARESQCSWPTPTIMFTTWTPGTIFSSLVCKRRCRWCPVIIRGRCPRSRP
jgi:hypothetical protein